MSIFDLAPTADVPRSTDKELPHYYRPCAGCGQEVLHATTRINGAEVPVMLDTDQARPKTYCVAFGKGDKQPLAQESAAYPVHRCRP